MNIFHRLRWQLTFSYTLVTVCTLLAITLLLGGVFLTPFFVASSDFDAEAMIAYFMQGDVYRLVGKMVSQNPVDTALINLYLQGARSTFSDTDLLRLGVIRLSLTTNATVRTVVVSKTGTVLGAAASDAAADLPWRVGHTFDPSQIAGLEAPFQAALAGETDPKRLYTFTEPNKRAIFAGPIFDQTGADPHRVRAVFVIELDEIPTRQVVPGYVLSFISQSLLAFLLASALMGALFGAYFAHGLSTRFRRISATIDQWSAGNFSRYINDATGDEIAQFTRSLDNMAQQLQNLLRQRQDMAISEERNRLARDLHDSAKQQALAASFELGAALALFNRDPDAAKQHLVAADGLVDEVRKELTNLVDELRPQPIEGLLSREDFLEVMEAHARVWAQRSNITLDFYVNGEGQIPFEKRETLYRILQEALANIARHSSASQTDIALEFKLEHISMLVKDNGHGFDPRQPHSGVGLASMRERAEATGGSFSLQSAPGQGVQIMVSLPVED